MTTHRWRVFSRRSRWSWYTRSTTRPERRPAGRSTRTSKCSTIVSVCTRHWATAARRSTRRSWVRSELGAPTPRREVHSRLSPLPTPATLPPRAPASKPAARAAVLLTAQTLAPRRQSATRPADVSPQVPRRPRRSAGTARRTPRRQGVQRESQNPPPLPDLYRPLRLRQHLHHPQHRRQD